MRLRMTYNAKKIKIGLKMTHNTIKNKKKSGDQNKKPSKAVLGFLPYYTQRGI